MVIARRRATKDCRRLIDVSGLRVTRNRCSACIGFFDEVVTIVGVDAGAGTGGFVDSSAEGIVFEALCGHFAGRTAHCKCSTIGERSL